MSTVRLAISFVLLMPFFVACGGGGGTNPDNQQTVPAAPTNITVNAGNAAISLGWLAPDDDGGAAINGYTLVITPDVAASNIHISGTRAVVSNLSNGVSYQLAVRARNTVGLGPASASVTVTPDGANPVAYTLITIDGDPGSPNGIFDPSLLRSSSGNDLWLAYSSVNFYTNGSGNVVQDVGIRIARSSDNGSSFDYVATVAAPYDGTVTDTDPGLSACGTAVCAGRWVYETSWLVEDVTDPDPDRRFKLFAPKYFIYPGSASSKTLYHLGAIVMWTASSPDSTWSTEEVVLDWPLTPPEFAAATDVTTLNAETANCLLVAEGGVTVNNGALDFVFACPYLDGTTTNILQKIILLRSTNHAAGFQFVSTLISRTNVPIGMDYYSAPALIVKEDLAPVLLVTPVINGAYSGSVVFPLGEQGLESSILSIPVQTPGHYGGASTYARDTGTLGVLQSDAILALPITNAQFRIVATHVMVEQ